MYNKRAIHKTSRSIIKSGLYDTSSRKNFLSLALGFELEYKYRDFLYVKYRAYQLRALVSFLLQSRPRIVRATVNRFDIHDVNYDFFTNRTREINNTIYVQERLAAINLRAVYIYAQLSFTPRTDTHIYIYSLRAIIIAADGCVQRYKESLSLSRAAAAEKRI